MVTGRPSAAEARASTKGMNQSQFHSRITATITTMGMPAKIPIRSARRRVIRPPIPS